MLGTINGTVYNENDKCDPDDFKNVISQPDDCPNLNVSSACIFYARNQPSSAIYMQVVYIDFPSLLSSIKQLML